MPQIAQSSDISHAPDAVYFSTLIVINAGPSLLCGGDHISIEEESYVV